ncbi:MAG: hypothetical protein QM741_09460 [Rudaea sp.]|uniref:hypothetical protein n=1 Tax=Rudaea sp. TaxID=2136325 RepID=UPI0039E405A4
MGGVRRPARLLLPLAVAQSSASRPGRPDAMKIHWLSPPAYDGSAVVATAAAKRLRAPPDATVPDNGLRFTGAPGHRIWQPDRATFRRGLALRLVAALFIALFILIAAAVDTTFALAQSPGAIYMIALIWLSFLPAWRQRRLRVALGPDALDLRLPARRFDKLRLAAVDTRIPLRELAAVETRLQRVRGKYDVRRVYRLRLRDGELLPVFEDRFEWFIGVYFYGFRYDLRSLRRRLALMLEIARAAGVPFNEADPATLETARTDPASAWSGFVDLLGEANATNANG